MNVEQMRAWIKSKYPEGYINGKGGNRVHVDKAPHPQVIAAYYSMARRECKKKALRGTTTLRRDKQYTFNF